MIMFYRDCDECPTETSNKKAGGWNHIHCTLAFLSWNNMKKQHVPPQKGHLHSKLCCNQPLRSSLYISLGKFHQFRTQPFRTRVPPYPWPTPFHQWPRLIPTSFFGVTSQLIPPPAVQKKQLRGVQDPIRPPTANPNFFAIVLTAEIYAFFFGQREGGKHRIFFGGKTQNSHV